MAGVDDYAIPTGEVSEADQPRGTTADFAKTFGAGALNTGSNLAAASRYFLELGGSEHGADIARGFQQLLGAGADATTDSLNPETKKLLQANLTSDEFWSHPVLATALKTTNMAPSVAALAIPGGLLADAVGATVLASTAGGALGAGGVIDEFYKKLDSMPDKDLQDQSPKYKAMRELMDEKDARAKFNRDSLGWAPAINAVIGAAATAMGPAGTTARGLATRGTQAVVAPEVGRIGGALIGGTEGAVGGAAQAGVADITGQQAEVEANFRKDLDTAHAANAAIEGGALGGVLGGVAGAAFHGKAPERPGDRINQILNESTPQPKTGSTGTPAKPPELPNIGNPQSAPTRSDRDGAKPVKGSKKAPIPEVAANAPDPAQDAALKAMNPPALPPEAAAAPVAGPPPVPTEAAPSATPEAAPQAPTAPPTLDTGQNIPEKPQSIQEQLAQIGTGQRKAVMIPAGGEPVKEIPAGMRRTKTPRGSFVYDPKLTTAGEIQKLSRLGRENELLGLGPVSKPEADARTANGETPVAVTERTGPNSEVPGTEVKAAAGTDQTAPVQVQALEAQKTPGNVVGVETPLNVLQMRTAEKPPGPPRTGRVLRRLDSVDETAPLNVAGNLREGEVKEASGKRYSAKERAAVDEKIAAAKKIVDENPAHDFEREHLTNPEAREATIARARRMVDAAKEQGVKINRKLIESVKGDAASDNPSMQILAEARDLVATADKKGNAQGAKRTEATGRFWQRDASIRKGYSKEVLAERRAEGDQQKRVSQGEGDVPESAAGRATKIDDAAEVRTVRTKQGHAEEVTGAKAASAVRKVELTPEERARYETPAKKAATEALQIERNPTEAQKVAGNYRKGHRTVEGLQLTLENPRGGMRRGVDENGKPWAVKMPADYGYIKRTTGADGDHVDAYDGRNGTRHFIVDQLDHKTGAFDEHKVMLRFKDEAAAREAYEKAFSDGKGQDRLGAIHEVTADELKDWLARGDQREPHGAHLVRDMERVNFDEPLSKKPYKTVDAAEALAKMDFSKESGIGGTLGRFFQSRLRKLAEGVPVHYVSAEQMAKLFPESPEAAGMHVRERGQERSQVFMRKDLEEGLGRGQAGHVLLHELAHAVTVREIETVPGVHDAIAKLAAVAHQHMFEDNVVETRLEHGDRLDYAFSNAKEFIAEAFSNSEFQQRLAQIPITPELAKQLGLHQRSMTVWDVFRGYVKKAIEKLTGQLPNFDSVLDGILRVGEHATKIHEVEHFNPLKAEREGAPKFMQNEALNLTKDAGDAVKRILEHPRIQSSEHAPFALKLRTFDNIAQIADHYFGENNPVRKIQEAVERMRVTGERIFQKSEPLLRKLVAERQQNGEQFKEFSSLLHDATVANVHPDVPLTDAKNAHLGKNKTVGDAPWSKGQHPELAKRYRMLSPALQDLWHEVTRHYADTQNQMSLGIINNRILKLLGIEDQALGRRIHEGTLTDADKAQLDSHLDVIEKASELSKIEGPYVPLMRRGDFVVKGDRKVTSPGNAKVVAPNEFEFTSEKDAKTYASTSDLRATIKKVWVDEKTGELHQVDPATGEPHKMSATDLDSTARYRVQVQNRHVEFHPTRASAEARATELARDPAMDVHKVVPRLFEPGGGQAAELSASLAALVKKLEKSEAYKQSTPTQQAALRQAVEEAAAASHRSTRIASKALPRRGVQGYSEDLVRNAADYGESSSRYLAKLEHMPDVEAGMKQMEDQLKSDHSKVNQFGRTAIRNEVVKRVQGDNGFQQGGKFAGVVKRAMAVSFIDKLGSPAYSVINAMQPAMVTMPYLAGRHGIGRAATALGRAYSDVSAGRIVASGLRETGRRLKGATAPDDFIGDIRARLKSSDERALLDHLLDTGVVDPSAGLEIRTLVKDTSGIGGKVDTGIGYLEGVVREMPRAIEAINRTVTALAAYRLEKSRGAAHESAMQYASDAVNNTQFNYSATNSPALFNHPLAKLALQFKKYGQGIYQLIGSQIGKAYHNAKPGDRAEALKTLISLAATHMAMAGALGLPTEPFKYLVMASSLLGTGVSWSDVEDKIRRQAANVLGKTGGEVFARGLPRLLNMDLSRVGLDSVTSFGEPRSQKESDVKTWLFDSLAGPVVALGGDWIKGVNQIRNGEFEKAAENLVPLKAASDAMRAYRQSTEGKKSASGRQTMSAYSPAEAAMRVVGFGSGREAETGAANSAFYHKSTAQKEARAGLVNDWAQAIPAGKTKAMAAITRWNQDKDDATKIKMKELTAKLKRDADASSKSVHGLVANKRDKRFLSEGEIYNTR